MINRVTNFKDLKAAETIHIALEIERAYGRRLNHGFLSRHRDALIYLWEDEDETVNGYPLIRVGAIVKRLPEGDYLSKWWVHPSCVGAAYHREFREALFKRHQQLMWRAPANTTICAGYRRISSFQRSTLTIPRDSRSGLIYGAEYPWELFWNYNPADYHSPDHRLGQVLLMAQMPIDLERD